MPYDTFPSTRPEQNESERDRLGKIAQALSGGLPIPPADYVAYTYVGSTNNVATAVYKQGGVGGTTVATLTFAYVASGAADDDKISSITLT